MNSSKAASEIWKTLVMGSKRFDRVLGKVKIISARDGKCTAEMTVEEEHTNRNGTLHGGYTAIIVDVITSLALYTSKPVVGVSVNMHISYLKAASLGDQILIEAKTNKLGRTLAFLDVVIKKKEGGDLIATGSHTTFVR
ncbi:acyl-coenzyme A thioesterase 13-like isoform X2 [Lycorma delicatula]